MKHKITWHKENVKNAVSYLTAEKTHLESAIQRINKQLKNYEFRSYQIACAEGEGREAFDEELYRVKRGS